MVSGIRNAGSFSRFNISLSSQAPYFSPYFYSYDQQTANMTGCITNLALDENDQQLWSVSNINLMMFNEDDNYMTYEDIFIQNTYDDPIYGVFGKGSAVKEIIDLGIASGAWVSVIK